MQATLGIVTGILGTMLISSPGITPYLGSLAMLADSPRLRLLDTVARHLRLLTRLQIPVNLLMLFSGAGLLWRQRWGWFLAALLNLTAALACLFYVPQLLKPLLQLLDETSGAYAAWLCTLLLLLVPLAMLAFLFLDPVVRQFEHGNNQAN